MSDIYIRMALLLPISLLGLFGIIAAIRRITSLQSMCYKQAEAWRLAGRPDVADAFEKAARG